MVGLKLGRGERSLCDEVAEGRAFGFVGKRREGSRSCDEMKRAWMR